MNVKILLKKVGNHWYPSIEHDNLEEISLSPKLEKTLSILNKTKSESMSIWIEEQNTILYPNTIQFRDEDLNRYFTTNDEFDFIVYVGNKEFPVSSMLYSLLEDLFNFNFHKTLYSCEISSDYEI